MTWCCFGANQSFCEPFVDRKLHFSIQSRSVRSSLQPLRSARLQPPRTDTDTAQTRFRHRLRTVSEHSKARSLHWFRSDVYVLSGAISSVIGERFSASSNSLSRLSQPSRALQLLQLLQLPSSPFPHP